MACLKSQWLLKRPLTLSVMIFKLLTNLLLEQEWVSCCPVSVGSCMGALLVVCEGLC